MSRDYAHRAKSLLGLSLTAFVIAALVLPGSALAAASQVVKVNGVDVFCELDTPEAFVFFFAITRERTDDASFGFIDLFVEPTDPDAAVLGGGMDDPPLTPAGLGATFDVFDDATGDVAGSATIAATFAGTGEFRARRVYQDAVQKGIFEDLEVTGTISVATDAAPYVFDMADCDGGAQDRLDQIHHPNGPKPGGSVPSNDAPTGATSIAVGSQLQQWTGGAALASEAPCVMGTGDDVFEFALGRTVWFSIRGTGGQVTVDPSGSDFDTVIAAYAAPGLESLSCVDDDDVHQAQGALTIDTQEGVAYLVQIGGVVGVFGGDPEDPQWGRLRLRIS